MVSTTSTLAIISHATGASDAILQVGDYHLGWGPDVAVFGPEIVLYGDGGLYAELFDGVRDGRGRWSLLRGTLTEPQVHELLRLGEQLPADPTMGSLAVDSFPTLIVSASHRWEVNDRSVEPFASYLRDLTDRVRSLARQPWVPERWIVRPFPSPDCTVGTAPADETSWDAPVYPGVLDQFPIGTVSCDAAP